MQLPRARRAFRRRCFDQRCGIALEIPDIGKRVQRKAFGAAGRQFWAVAPKITERSRGGAVQACTSGQPKPNDGVGARQAKMEGAEAGSIHDPALFRHGPGDPAVDLVARSLSPARLPVEVAVHGDVVKVERSRKPRCERALAAAGAADHQDTVGFDQRRFQSGGDIHHRLPKEKPRRKSPRFDQKASAGAYSAASSSFFSRAALSRAKSSPAWWEERVSGLEATIRKPLL